MSASATLLVWMLEEDLYGNIPLHRAVLLAAKSMDLIWIRVNKSAHTCPARFTGHPNIGQRTGEGHALVIQITGPAALVGDFKEQYKDLLETTSGTAVLLHGRFV